MLMIIWISNLQLVAAEYWRKQTSTVKNLKKNAGIGQHIAHLFVNNEVLDSLNGKYNFFGQLNKRLDGELSLKYMMGQDSDKDCYFKN